MRLLRNHLLPLPFQWNLFSSPDLPKILVHKFPLVIFSYWVDPPSSILPPFMPILVIRFFALISCVVIFIGQSDRHANGRESPRDCANFNLFSSTIAAQTYASCEACESPNSLLVRSILQPRLHSQRSDKGTPIFPTYFPAFFS